MIKSYIINLDRDRERMTHMDKRFGELGLPYERIPAVYGKDFPQQEFEAFVAARPMTGSGDLYSEKPRKWTPSRMGCFLSHYKTWERIAEGEDEFAAIFEDDIHISENIVPLLSSTNWIPADCDILRLEPSYNRIKSHKAGMVDGRALNRIIHSYNDYCWPVCTAAMIMRKQTAQKLLRVAPEKHMIADIFLFACKESPTAATLTTYQLSPAVCIQDKFLYQDQSAATFKSNIDISETNERQESVFSALIRKTIVMLRVLQGHRKVEYQG